VKGSHAFFKDLDVRLISPKGTEIVLFKNRCGNYNGNFNLKFDDISQIAFSCPPSNIGTSYRPESPLTPLVGQTSEGTWTLRVKDTEISSGGTIDAFQIEFCAAASINPPFLVNNNTLQIVSGANAVITPELLRVDDANNTHAQLTFILLSVPQNGELRLNGNVLQPGGQFTQEDIDLGHLQFFDNGATNLLDGFRFVATDNEGGFVATPKFNIKREGVGTDEPGKTTLTFGLSPNPATESVWVTFDRPATTDMQIRMFNMGGQLIQSVQLPQGSSRLQLLLSNLPQGVYAVQVESEQGTGVKKLVVK
jgi:subtilisin-like proprotein convertase family protein